MSQEEQDLILGRLRAIRNPSEHISAHDTSLHIGKCGLRVGFEVVRIWPFLTPLQKVQARSLLDPPQMQTDTVIGRFRIHFDTTNVNGHEPALLDSNQQRIPGTARAYVDSVGKYFNETWNYEIDFLGYNEPPLESGQSYYNIHVRNLGSGLYGQTIFPGPPINPGQTPPRYTTYIEVHKDFQFFYSPGMAGLKVTAAHEFHHAIQLGSYGFWGNDIYFYEITSTWMEDVVYDDVNDYHQYIRTPTGLPLGHFATPDRSFNIDDGFIEYSRAVWGKYVEKKFGPALMTRIWEFMREVPSLVAVEFGLRERVSSLRRAFVEFAMWNYFTGSRADTVNCYTEGRNYPLVRLKDSTQFSPPMITFSDNSGIQGLGSAYYRVFLNPSQTVIPIVSNLDIDSAGNGFASQFQYTLQSIPPSDSTYTNFIVNDTMYWAKVSTPGRQVAWNLLHGVNNAIFGDTTIRSDTTVPKPVAQILVYPNPFIPSQHRTMRFQLPTINSKSATVYIYSSDLQLIYHDDKILSENLVNPQYITWDGKASNGEQAASGVYVLVLQVADQLYKDKFVILR